MLAPSPEPRVNYLSHGRDLVDEPWGLAGAALPDWLGVVHRRSRVDRARAEELALRDDGVGALARGALRHLEEDRWFHSTPAFHEVTGELTRRLRAKYPGTKLRASFLAHVLMEMLLDAALDARGEVTFERYYGSLEQLELARVAAAAEAIVGAPLPRFIPLVELFLDVRFLCGYREDGPLVQRLEGLCRRVRLPHLPADLVTLVPAARALVAERADDLLTPPPA